MDTKNVIKIVKEEPLIVHMNIITRDLQELMNNCYYVWQTIKVDSSKHQILNALSEYHRIAVMLGNLNYQVENGGFSQWIFNGYAEEDIQLLYIFILKALNSNKIKNTKYYNQLERLKYMLTDYYEVVMRFNDRGYLYVSCYSCDGQGTYESEDDDDSEFGEYEDCYDCNATGEVKSVNFTHEYYTDSSRYDNEYYTYKWIDLYQYLVDNYEIIAKEIVHAKY